MQTIAQGLLVLQLTGSGTSLGFMLALQFLPILLFGASAGVLIDRYSKRKILFVTQAASGGLALLIGVLVAFHLVTLWMVYVLAILHGLIIAIDNPARQTFLVEMVGKDLIKNAISLNSSEVNFARIIGPALAGIITATVGLVACFIINGISFIAVLVVLFMMKGEDFHLSPRAPRIKGQLKEGLQYVRASPVLKNTLILVAIIGTLSYEFPVILPLFAEFTFHNGTAGYAALTSAMGFGAIIGGLFSAGRKKATTKILTRTSILFGISILAAAITPNLTSAIVVMVFVGIFSVTLLSLANTILQLECDASMRGRVMSLWGVAFLGSTPIGGPLIGWIGETVGPRWGLAIGGFAAIAAAALYTLFSQQSLSKKIQVAREDLSY
jgi:MFS family permease